MYPELIKLMAIEGINHKKLGQIMGVTQQAASKKLKGEYDFKCNEMRKIKEHFKQKYPNITMDQIFTKEFFYLQGA
jgi:predicted transcriptional regulator